MPNILEYVRWRGDIPFSAMNLNEVDSLIFATLSYIPFEGIVPAPGEGELPLSKAAKLFASSHPGWEKAGSSFVDMVPRLLMACASCPRFEDILLRSYVSELTEKIQFSAIEFALPNGITYVAFRGTDNSIIGWKEDFYLSVGTVPAQRAAAAFINDLFSNRPLSGKSLCLGGHSKGGNLAEYAASCCDEAIQKNILQVYNFDGPGFDADFLKGPGFQRIADKITFVVPSYPIVGELLCHGPKEKIAKSTQKTVLAHDPFTWQLYGPCFEEAYSIDKSAAFFNQALDDWITNLSPQECKEFIDDFFAVLEAPGLVTLDELYSTGLPVLTPMMQRLSKVNPKSQKVILRLIRSILDNASGLATDTLNKWFPMT